MDVKEFLKPTKITMIIFILLIIITFAALKIQSDNASKGSNIAQNVLLVPWVTQFSYINLVYDAIACYLISCVIVYIYNKVKKNANR